MAWYEPWTWGDDDQAPLGSQGNPSNYNQQPAQVGGPWGAVGDVQSGWGGPGEIAGGGAVPFGSLNLPYFQQDRNDITKTMDGQSPFAGSEWGSLISQLQQRAAGTGPSIAGDAYKQASQDSQNSLASLSQNSSSPGGARQAILQSGKIQQGLAQGYGAARNQEMIGAEGALAQTLGQRDQINSNAYTNLLAQKLGLSANQLKALQGDQQYSLGQQQIDQQRSASKWMALSSLFGAAAKFSQSAPVPGGGAP